MKRALVELTRSCPCGADFHYDAAHPPPTGNGPQRARPAPPQQRPAPSQQKAPPAPAQRQGPSPAPAPPAPIVDLVVVSAQFTSKAGSRAEALRDLRALFDKKAPGLRVALPEFALYIGDDIWFAVNGLRDPRPPVARGPAPG